MIRVTDVATYMAGVDRIGQLEKTIGVLNDNVVSYKTAMEIEQKRFKTLREELEDLKQRFGIFEESLKDGTLKAVSEGYHLKAGIKTLKTANKTDITARTIGVAEAFGLGVDERKEHIIYDNAKFENRSNISRIID